MFDGLVLSGAEVHGLTQDMQQGRNTLPRYRLEGRFDRDFAFPQVVDTWTGLRGLWISNCAVGFVPGLRIGVNGKIEYDPDDPRPVTPFEPLKITEPVPGVEVQ
jgi:hypothetical protein